MGVLRYTDRSRTETTWVCRRARYWGYEWQGIGLAPQQKPGALEFGGAVAEQLQQIKLGKAWVVPPQLSGDSALLAEGLLYGYETRIWPKWLKHYELVGTEVEQPLALTDWLIYNSRPDTLTRRRSDGILCYGPEDKTTGWVDSLLTYRNNIQLHATAIATEKVRGEPVGLCLIQGLYKGFVKEGKLYHPLIYAYMKEGRAGIVPDQWSAKYQRGNGWERVATTNSEGGVRGWVDAADEATIASVYPNSEPVTPNGTLVEAYFKQLILSEAAISQWHQQGCPEGELDRVFPQNFNACDDFGGFKRQCEWHGMCYNPTTRKFPLSLYKKREPHHPEGEPIG